MNMSRSFPNIQKDRVHGISPGEHGQGAVGQTYLEGSENFQRKAQTVFLDS